MEEQKTEKKRIPRNRIFNWLVIIFFLFFMFSVFDALWKIRKINTGAIWQVPSKIYSDSTRIARGVDIKQTGFDARLERLGYRQVGEVSSAGQYSKSSGSITIYLHPFEYPEKSFDGEIIKINRSGNTVSSVARQENGKWEKAEEVFLEPEIITELFGKAGEDRELISLSSCPPDLINAILCTEDRRFYEHHGIDFTSIMRAAFVNFEEGGVAEGGSTITQQLVKNLFLSSKRKITRKIREAWISIFVEILYSKEEILEMYMNEIYMGQRGHVSINGVARAAKLYFDKDVSQITLEEAALLAGIIRAPNYYSPYTHQNKAMARRNTVLEVMLHENKISKDAYKTAIRKPINVVPIETPKRYASYFIDYVLSCIETQYPADSLSRGGYHIFTTMDMHMQSVAENMLAHFIQSVKNRKSQEPIPEVEGAVLICDPKTGAIKAMVGGTDYAKTQFNRAVQTRRQIGSLVKPVIYYTALRRGYTLSSLIQDEPLTLNLKDGPWTPSNFDEVNHGPVMLIDALAHSYNLATVRLGLDVGIENVYTEVKNILPDAKVSKNPSILLGAIDLSPLDVANLYYPFANMGSVKDSFMVKAITTDNGALITKDDEEKKEQRKLDPSVIFLVNEGLGKVLTVGTARAAFLYGMPWGIHGKTGTTNDLRDSWFVGFTPNTLVVTWLGNDDFQPIGLSGSEGATQVAAMILGELEKPTRWDVPDDITYCKIDPTNGKLASPYSESVELAYIKGTEPKEVSKKEAQRFRVLRFFKSLFDRD
jgi:penicillin-binding protein 1B